MTTKPVVVYLGTLPANDSFYTGGWRFIMNPRCRAPRRTEERPSADEAPHEPNAQDPESTPPNPAAD
jgi:hypothetical protein